MKRAGRNDPCPCGSGKKYKKCCLDVESAAVPYTQEDRASALGMLEEFIGEQMGPEDDDAFERFYEGWDDEIEELDENWAETDDACFDMWFAFDVRLRNGRRPFEELLRSAAPLCLGARVFLERVAQAPVCLYEVVDAAPGLSITLRDLESGGSVTVRECSASRSVTRGTLLAARVVVPGASGQPEMERGVLPLPSLERDSLLEALRQLRSSVPPVEQREAVGNLLHHRWLAALLRPQPPSVTNTDGDQVLFTEVRFEASDPDAITVRLAKCAGLEAAAAGEWHWVGPAPDGAIAISPGQPVALGRIVLADGVLSLECNSAQRAARGRDLLEGLAPGLLRHLSTTHESPAGAQRADTAALPPETVLSIEEQEALVLDHMASYYRDWIDQPLPALDGYTPREAAEDPKLRSRAANLIRGLEGWYERALRDRQPAYDPSWMWAELGLSQGESRTHPPPLARERMELLLPEMGAVCCQLAAQVMNRPGFDERTGVIEAQDLQTSLAAQRFLRAKPVDEPRQGAGFGAPASLAETVHWLAEYELHRRKTFWVDDALAYLLATTDPDVPGSQLRVPFPSFALVWTDRFTLSMAERFLAREQGCPLAGYRLRVLTVHVSEDRSPTGRALRIGLAADSLGADPPYWHRCDVPLEDDTSVQCVLDAVAPYVEIAPPVADSHPLRGLLRLTLNAILYSVSAGVEAEIRLPPAPPARGPFLQPYSSEQVHYLPGTIDISRVRQLQQLDRLPSGRPLLHRFMVRGHWRRPAADWQDQRMRWIEPYWKGPDLAAVIEKAYRLQP